MTGEEELAAAIARVAAGQGTSEDSPSPSSLAAAATLIAQAIGDEGGGVYASRMREPPSRAEFESLRREVEKLRQRIEGDPDYIANGGRPGRAEMWRAGLRRRTFWLEADIRSLREILPVARIVGFVVRNIKTIGAILAALVSGSALSWDKVTDLLVGLFGGS